MNRLKDPRLGFVSITDVELTDDLKHAKVYVSILKEEERELTMEIISSAKSFIRSELGRRVRMKFLPTLEFRLDTTLDYASKIEGLLKKVRPEGMPQDSGNDIEEAGEEPREEPKEEKEDKE